MAYFEKYSITIPAASSAKLGSVATTNVQYGYLEAVTVFPDATNPFVAGSSALITIRAGSTTGRLIFRSSSALLNAEKRYFPRAAANNSTSGAVVASSHLTSKIPVCQETLHLIRFCSSSGSTQGTAGRVDIIIGG